MLLRLRSLFLLVGLLLAASSMFGQGSTTASMAGTVKDANGAPLPGATIKVVHVPSGTIAGGYSNTDGRFAVQNLRVGGPYTVEVTFLGYETFVKSGVQLNLGQTFDFDVTLQEEGVTVDEVVITAQTGDLFDGNRTGMETNITTAQIQTAPSVNRSLGDFARLTPQVQVDANGAISVAGSNNRYNNISIDGAVSNDVFGLAASGTPGGQTNSRNGTQTSGVISVDALEAIQVVIAPYDVRQGGFTGGGINAVTRSGTNTLEGSVYFFHRDQSLTGRYVLERPNGKDEIYEFGQDFNYDQVGFRVGGPIMKNKLFYFVSYERTRSSEPRILLPGDPGREQFVSESSVADLRKIGDYFRDLYGYPETNDIDPYTNEFENDKVLLKLDWNINQTHRLSLRHNYVRSNKLEGPSNSTFNYTFHGGGQDFESVFNSTVAELSSTWTNTSNKFRLVFQTTKDDRDPNMAPYPNVRIDNVDGSADVFVGNELFSMVNKLDQTNIALTNDFTLQTGNHTLTFGTHNEYFRFTNSFIRAAYGSYRISWGSLEPLIDSGTEFTIPTTDYQVSYVNPELGLPADWGPEFDAFQFGLYAQDEWAVNAKLKVSIGFRVDMPYVTADPAANDAFNNDPLFAEYDVQTQQTPDARLMLSPRLGFNYDVFGDKTFQLRGGVGLFTGRIPFVWISNQFGNTGVEIVRFENLSSPMGSIRIPFTYEPGQDRLGALTIPQYNDLLRAAGVAEDDLLSPRTSEINVTAKDFRYPQVLRATMGFDYKLPFWGMISSVDFMFGKTLNGIHYQDLNLGESTQNFALPAGATSGDTRPIYPGTGNSRTDLTTAYTNVLLLTNTNRGYQFNATIQLIKPLDKGFSGTLAYTYGRSTSVNDGTSSQAISNWRFTPNVTGLNDLDNVASTTSNFQLDHRIIASAGYGFNWAGSLFRTTFTFFYKGESGQPFSYIYGADVNREDRENFRENDLIFIPADQTQIQFEPLTTYTNDQGQAVFITAEEQWALLDEYIRNDPYLSKHRGEYMERNGARTPWNHQLDLSIRHDINFDIAGKQRTLQLTLDIFNFANWLNEKWGRQYFISFNTYQLIDFVSLAADNVPVFKFTPQQVPDFNEPYSTSNQSFWSMQVGARFIF